MNRNIFYKAGEVIDTETSDGYRKCTGGKSSRNIELSDSLFISDYQPSTNTQDINDRLMDAMSKRYNTHSDYYPLKGGFNGYTETETEVRTTTQHTTDNNTKTELSETTSESVVVPTFSEYSTTSHQSRGYGFSQTSERKSLDSLESLESLESSESPNLDTFSIPEPAMYKYNITESPTSQTSSIKTTSTYRLRR